MSDGNHEVNRLRARAAYQEMVARLERYERALRDIKGRYEWRQGGLTLRTETDLARDMYDEACQALEGETE